MTHCPQCNRKYGKRRRCYYCNGRPKNGEDRTCKQCWKHFYVQAHQIKNYAGGGSYCSRKCTVAGVTGRKFRLKKDEVTRYVRSDGYVMVKVSIHRFQLEHRLVIEREIGRKLKRNETVHHLNGTKTDNQPENLQVLSNSEHAKLHAALGTGRWRRSKS